MPRATVTSSAVVRTVSSVPSTPTAVVTPPAVSRLSASGGTRVCGPASPPPPVRCTCPSIRPGMTRRPATSTSSTRSARSSDGISRPDPDDPLAGHEQVPAPRGRGVVQLGVAEQDERRTVHSSLKPPTAPVSRSAASARCVAHDEISSVDALSCSAAAAISSAAAA